MGGESELTTSIKAKCLWGVKSPTQNEMERVLPPPATTTLCHPRHKAGAMLGMASRKTVMSR